MASLKFLKAALKDYRVGAFTVSSRYAVRKVLKAVEPSHKFIIEYGAGDGVVTKEILRLLPKDGRLIVIELNPEFLKELGRIKDKRLKIINGNVIALSKKLNQLGLPRIDLIISNIPFTILKKQDKESIIKHAWQALNAGGIFLVYQYSPILLPLLKKYFKEVKVGFEPRNFPPYFFMTARKTTTEQRLDKLDKR